MAAYAIQFRRGTTTQHSSFTGLLGEVTVDTDKKTLVVHDGSTTGGFPLAREGAASTASTGTFTSNVSIGGTLAITSTASFSDDVTIAGDLGMTGHIIPSANITYDLGSSTMMWRDIYVGPGSLYVNGKKVIEDNSGTIQVSTDADQNLKVATSGTGVLQLSSSNGIALDGELNTSSGDIQVGDHMDMNSNLIKELATPVSGTDAANKNYVDSAISTGLAAGTASFDGVDGDFSGNVVIDGNLTVSGTQTIINTSQINLADNILLLNSDATGTASASAGIEVERGDDLNVQFLWDEANDRWSAGAEDVYAATFIGNLTGDVTGTVSSLSNHDTDDLAEGSNLYYTQARFDAAFAAKDTDDLSEGTSALFFTDTRVDTRLSSGSMTTLKTGTFEVNASGMTVDVDINVNSGKFEINSTTGAMTVAGPTIINNTFNAGDDVTFSGDNTFNISNSSNTDVFAIDVANTTFAIDLDMTVNNSATFKNDFAITNSSNTNLFDVDVANTNLAIDLDMTVNNSATFNNNIAINNSSSTTLVDIDVTANTYDIDMDLTVNNSAVFNNNLTINNTSSTTMVDIDVVNATFDIDMAFTVNNATTVNNNFTVNNTSSTTVFDIDVVNTTLDIDLDVTMNNEVTINNNLILGSGLTLSTSAENTIKGLMSQTHSTEYVVTSTDSTNNASATASTRQLSAATLGFNAAGAAVFMLFLNRQLLRQSEYSVDSSGNVTFAQNLLATDDEIEAVIYK